MAAGRQNVPKPAHGRKRRVGNGGEKTSRIRALVFLLGIVAGCSATCSVVSPEGHLRQAITSGSVEADLRESAVESGALSLSGNAG
jgi:hypothetical protein